MINKQPKKKNLTACHHDDFWMIQVCTICHCWYSSQITNINHCYLQSICHSFQLSYFKSQKILLSKCCTQYVRKFGQLSGGLRTGKGQFTFQCQRMFELHTMAFISHTSKVTLIILQIRFQQYMNWEILGVQTGFRKDRGTSDQDANMCWIIEKAKAFPPKSISLSLTMLVFDCVDHNKLWEILQEMGY